MSGIDPAALVGVDENRAVPGLVGDINQLIPIPNQAGPASLDEDDMDIDHTCKNDCFGWYCYGSPGMLLNNLNYYTYITNYYLALCL